MTGTGNGLNHSPSCADGAIRSVLILMAKAPIAGLSKTRLIPALGTAGAQKLSRRLLDHALEQAVTAAPPILDICCTPDAGHAIFQQFSGRPGVRLSRQVDGDIGARMAAAVARYFPGDRGVLVMGTDAPGLSAGAIRRADRALRCHDVVIVPALDGGYALIGIRRELPSLFAGIAWSTPKVMAETRRKLSALGARWQELPAVADIDDEEDLQHLPVEWLA